MWSKGALNRNLPLSARKKPRPGGNNGLLGGIPRVEIVRGWKAEVFDKGQTRKSYSSFERYFLHDSCLTSYPAFGCLFNLPHHWLRECDSLETVLGDVSLIFLTLLPSPTYFKVDPRALGCLYSAKGFRALSSSYLKLIMRLAISLSFR